MRQMLWQDAETCRNRHVAKYVFREGRVRRCDEIMSARSECCLLREHVSYLGRRIPQENGARSDGRWLEPSYVAARLVWGFPPVQREDIGLNEEICLFKGFSNEHLADNTKLMYDTLHICPFCFI